MTEATQVVIDGMDLLSIGQEWPDANTAYAAAVCAAAAVVDAAYAAADAAYAAADAAYAAADAVNPSYGAVAYAAARSRQAKDLLQLITDAEVS